MLPPRCEGVSIGEVGAARRTYPGEQVVRYPTSLWIMRVLANLMCRYNTPALMVIWRAICCNLLDIRKETKVENWPAQAGDGSH
jgi:hypothetical protein